MSNLDNAVPVNKEQWELMSPTSQGYFSYMYSSWPGSDIPEDNPYGHDTVEWHDFERGTMQAVLDAQDSED